MRGFEDWLNLSTVASEKREADRKGLVKLELSFDSKGYAYDYSPTLESQDFPERGIYFCLHDLSARIKAGQGGSPYAVSVFTLPETDNENGENEPGFTEEFRTLEAVAGYLRAFGVYFDPSEEDFQKWIKG